MLSHTAVNDVGQFIPWFNIKINVFHSVFYNQSIPFNFFEGVTVITD